MTEISVAVAYLLVALDEARAELGGQETLDVAKTETIEILGPSHLSVGGSELRLIAGDTFDVHFTFTTQVSALNAHEVRAERDALAAKLAAVETLCADHRRWAAQTRSLVPLVPVHDVEAALNPQRGDES